MQRLNALIHQTIKRVRWEDLVFARHSSLRSAEAHHSVLDHSARSFPAQNWRTPPTFFFALLAWEKGSALNSHLKETLIPINGSLPAELKWQLDVTQDPWHQIFIHYKGLGILNSWKPRKARGCSPSLHKVLCTFRDSSWSIWAPDLWLFSLINDSVTSLVRCGQGAAFWSQVITPL